MENMTLYDTVRSVPGNAQKPIAGGRLKGMTDINPMWRIQTLTEQFGPCGFGWKYEITRMDLTPGAKGEIAAFVDVSLYVKRDDTWSAPIPGTGGASFVAAESGGLHTSDECYKMALTDALGVACKALGFGADIYWSAGGIKYDEPKRQPALLCADCKQEIIGVKTGGKTYTAPEIAEKTRDTHGRTLCWTCGKAAGKCAEEGPV